MATNSSQHQKARESMETNQADSLNRILDQNRMSQVRQEIGIIADRSYRNNLIDDEAYHEYRKLAEGREEHEVSAEMLVSTRKFAKEHEEKAIKIHQSLQQAIRQKIASQRDEEFLMENLVVENIHFAKQSGEVEKLINDKIKRMQKDRERYDSLAQHPLIKDMGYLKVDDHLKL